MLNPTMALDKDLTQISCLLYISSKEQRVVDTLILTSYTGFRCESY